MPHIESNHFRALVESYAYRKTSSGGHIGFLSLITRPATMRSLIANLYKRELTYFSCADSSSPPLLLTLPPHDSGWTFRSFHSPMPSGLLSTLLLPIQATQYGIAMNQPALLIDRARTGTESTPPDQFFPILNKLTSYPILPEWCPTIWRWGVRDQWITQLIADPYPTYEIHPRGLDLQLQISKGLLQHELRVTQTHST